MPASRQAVARYKRQLAVYQTRAAVVLTNSWDRLGTYTEDDIPRFVEQTAPTITAAKGASVALSAAFFAFTLGTRPVGVNPDAVEAEARTRDPFLAAWHAVSEGRPWEEAAAAGRSMAEAVAHNFVTSTARRTGDEVARRSKQDQVRWRRIPAADACEFCRTVSGQLYHSAESADFGHDRCSCAVVPAA